MESENNRGVIPGVSTQTFWEARVRALTRRINFAAWLARFTPALFFLASTFAVGVYALRRVEIPTAGAVAGFVGALALTGAACWWRARAGFFRRDDARVLLESHLRLDARLTAAELGLVAWPPEPDFIAPLISWRLKSVAGWIGASFALVALAVLTPVPRDSARPHAVGAPPALVQTEAMLGAVKEMNVADTQALEQFEQRTRELARRPTDEQYAHSALEAADALRDQTALAISGLATSLESTANALGADESQQDSSLSSLASALSGLRDGGMPANKDLLVALGSAADIKNLTPQQRAQLARQLSNLSRGLKGVAGANGAGAEVAAPDPDSTATVVAGGGPGGGGETAPLLFNLNASDAGDGQAQGLSAEALKRFAVGDKLGTATGAHEVDPAKAIAPTAAGAVGSAATGGEAVWVNRLTPAERAALKNFFK